MSTETKRECPFCGGLRLSDVVDDGIAWIKCISCGATGPRLTKYSGEEDTPFIDWNSRIATHSPADAGGLNPDSRKTVDIAEPGIAEPLGANRTGRKVAVDAPESLSTPYQDLAISPATYAAGWRDAVSAAAKIMDEATEMHKAMESVNRANNQWELRSQRGVARRECARHATAIRALLPTPPLEMK